MIDLFGRHVLLLIMDPNVQNPQGESDAVSKLEQDLRNIKEETAAVQSLPENPPTVQVNQPIPEVPPVPNVTTIAPVTQVTESPPVIPVQTNTFIPESPKKSSPILIIAIILAVVAVLAVLAYVFGAKLLAPKTTQTACTMEAKICPDGSSVGRIAPDCEFAACPVVVATPIENPSTTASPSAIPSVLPSASPSSTPSGTPSSDGSG